MTVDAHVHLWDRALDPQPWIDPATMGEIDRDFLTADLVWMLRDSRADRAVVVQSVTEPDETRRLLLDTSPAIAGVVGWLDLEGDVPGQLAALPDGRLVGVRHLVHVDPDPEWLSRPAVGAGLDALASADLAFDLVVRAHQLPLAARVADAHPGVRFVLDHLGGVAETDDVASWTAEVRRLAERPHVVAKLSGLWRIGDGDAVRRIVDTALEAFGPGRLMYGSDWPLVRLGGDAARWRETVDATLAALSEAERDRVMERTAVRAYRLDRW